MPMTLRAVLEHPSLRAADPVLRAGSDRVPRTHVRWIHSSEVLEIAPLLRGGELLLTGGVTIAGASTEERHRYITELADRGVAALAVETGGRLRQLPPELLTTADEVGLPLVELRRVVPFVEVAQEINSFLVNQSVTHLQQADRLSHLLSQRLAAGRGMEELLADLATTVHAPVTLTDRSGVLLAAADADGRPMDEQAALVAAVRWVPTDVPVQGIVVATLRVGGSRDPELTSLVADRAVDALSLALVRHRPPNPAEIAATEFLRQARDGAPEWRLRRLASAAGIAPDSALVAVAGRVRGTGYRAGLVEQVLRRRGRRAVSLVVGRELSALVQLPGAPVRSERAVLRADLEASDLAKDVLLAVGPADPDPGRAPRLLAEATLTLDLAANQLHTSAVLDSEAWATERLASRHLPGEAQDAFVQELLGDLLRHEQERGTPLLETLDRWLASGCSTTATSRLLLLRRQSLHHRLQRIFELLGGDPRDSDRLAAVHLAVRLARTARAGGSPHPARLSRAGGGPRHPG